MRASKLAPGPVRPSIRVGIEQEGLHTGEPTVVVLGPVPWRHIKAALDDVVAGHVYWEVGDGERPWRMVRRILDRQRTVTVEVSDPAVVPPDLLKQVEVVVRVPASWRSVDTVKVNHGDFVVSWTTLGRPWTVKRASDYRADWQKWP